MVNGLCAVVILYHPDEEVFGNISTYTAPLEQLWIVDNTENGLQNLQTRFAGLDRVSVIQDGVNQGIGTRINTVIQLATARGFDWLLTMDQDSFFTPDNLAAYEKIISGLNLNGDIALLGTGYSHEDRPPEGHVVLKQEPALITSGTCINLRAVKDIGMMNEELFIDEVDSDFAYRAIIKGWKVVTCQGIYLRHKLGQRIRVRSIVSGKITERYIHPAVRLYYITRNFLWVRNKYKDQFQELFKTRARQMVHVYKNNLLYNKDRLHVLKMVWRGYRDYKRNKLGKLIQ